MTDRARVVLVDDHEMARRGIAAMLGAADWIEVAGEADGCATGIDLVESLRPDIVLLDIRMPGVDGLACLERLKGLEHPVAVVMVTLYDDRRYVLEAIRRGAAGYLLKDATTTEIIATLRAVSEGHLAIEPDLLREALATVDEPAAGDSGRARAEAFAVTTREHEVLLLVAEGLTNKEIGARLSITEDTVKKHVQNLIRKLGAADRTQAAITALRMGLIEPDV